MPLPYERERIAPLPTGEEHRALHIDRVFEFGRKAVHFALHPAQHLHAIAHEFKAGTGMLEPQERPEYTDLQSSRGE